MEKITARPTIENIEIKNGDSGPMATGHLVSGGSEYTQDNIVELLGHGGVTATFTIDSVEEGVITAVTLIQGGEGYYVGFEGDLYEAPESTGFGATYYVDTITAVPIEHSYELPEGTTRFEVKLRNPGYPLKICFVSGGSGTTYKNLPAGQSYREDDIKRGPNILYFQCATNGEIVEIISWV